MNQLSFLMKTTHEMRSTQILEWEGDPTSPYCHVHSLVITQLSCLQLPWHLSEHMNHVFTQGDQGMISAFPQQRHIGEKPLNRDGRRRTANAKVCTEDFIWQDTVKHQQFLTLHITAWRICALVAALENSWDRTQIPSFTPWSEMNSTPTFTPLHTNHYVNFYLNTILSKTTRAVCFYSLEVFVTDYSNKDKCRHIVHQFNLFQCQIFLLLNLFHDTQTRKRLWT